MTEVSEPRAEVLKPTPASQPTSGLIFTPIRWRWPAALDLHPIVWVLAIFIAVVSWIWGPQGGYDWHNFFAIAARNWWPNPWAYIKDFPYVPWTGLLLSPLGGVTDQLATTITNTMSVIVMACVAKHLGGPSWVVVPVLLSPPGYWLFSTGQVDGLILSGLLFFNGLDLVIIAIKPQLAIGVFIARLKRSKGQWLRYLAPAVLVGVLSLLIWPGWPLRALPDPQPYWLKASWNTAVWPWGVPVALGLLWYAWRTGEDSWGIVASPLLSPYVNVANWLGLMLALAAKWPRVALIIWLAMWLAVIIWYFLVSR
jgi:hypothetical protein